MNLKSTDILLIHSKYRNKTSVGKFNIELEEVPIVTTLVKSQWGSFDEHMIFGGYVHLLDNEEVH